ncbi:hypothetical protein Ciccas_007567 [Cichlidogyrus casuarinus]|uniref:Uncharacterized protein n=1 Tax=Cichlidogyrus casuarinus TaxID=1844966 RepID=A0ABD2Q399_9PLAT
MYENKFQAQLQDLEGSLFWSTIEFSIRPEFFQILASKQYEKVYISFDDSHHLAIAVLCKQDNHYRILEVNTPNVGVLQTCLWPGFHTIFKLSHYSMKLNLYIKPNYIADRNISPPCSVLLDSYDKSDYPLKYFVFFSDEKPTHEVCESEELYANVIDNIYSACQYANINTR